MNNEIKTNDIDFKEYWEEQLNKQEIIKELVENGIMFRKALRLDSKEKTELNEMALKWIEENIAGCKWGIEHAAKRKLEVQS